MVKHTSDTRVSSLCAAQTKMAGNKLRRVRTAQEQNRLDVVPYCWRQLNISVENAQYTETHFLAHRTIARAKMTTAFYDGAGKALHAVSPDKHDEVSTCSTSATTVRMSNRRNKRPANVVCEVFFSAIILGSGTSVSHQYSDRVSCCFKGIRQDLTQSPCLLLFCFSTQDPT